MNSQYSNVVIEGNTAVVFPAHESVTMRLNEQAMDSVEQQGFSTPNDVFKKIPWGGAALLVFMGFSVLSLASLTSLALVFV